MRWAGKVGLNDPRLIGQRPRRGARGAAPPLSGGGQEHSREIQERQQRDLVTHCLHTVFPPYAPELLPGFGRGAGQFTRCNGLAGGTGQGAERRR